MYNHEYFVYITTNPNRKVLYVGMSNNLPQRIIEHFMNRGDSKTFPGKYYCYNLLYYEIYNYVKDAIAREKEVKKWSRKKKEALIATMNPDWIFLNSAIMVWPPREQFIRGWDKDIG